MRTSRNSPFRPGSDTVPEVWAGRVAQLSDFRDVVLPRRLDGIPERGRVILGESGSGKSALVRRLAGEAKDAGAWVTDQIRVPLGQDPVQRLAAELLALADTAGLSHGRNERLGKILKSVESVAVAGVSLTTRPTPPVDASRALTSLLIELGQAAAKEPGRLVMVHLDEVQNMTEEIQRSQLLITLGDALAHEERVTAAGGAQFSQALPLVVYLTGLPEFSILAGAHAGATFVRRFKLDVLEGIADDDLSQALRPFVSEGWPVLGSDGQPHAIRMTEEAQARIVSLACNEPFLFQLAGERAWLADTSEIITEEHVLQGWKGVQREAELHVTRLLERMPARERQLIDAMASLAPEDRTATQIAKAMGLRTAGQIGTIAQRLDLGRGLIARGSTYSFRNRALEAMLTTDWPAV